MTQDAALTLVPEVHKLDAWHDLPRVNCPTLVLHRPWLPLLPAGAPTLASVRDMPPTPRPAP